jgi:AcrR family transcriptional regulator
MVQEKSERGSSFAGGHRPRAATGARHEELRRHLLALAECVVAEEGLAALRARNLADAAGCSVGAIYNVFADLDQLVLEINANTLRAISKAMAGIKDGDPQQRLLAMADAYVLYASSHRLLWDALFNHRMPLEDPVPHWFQPVQDEAFSHIEGPLAALRPDLDGPACRLLGRSIFASVHGMVALGLDNRLAPMSLDLLRGQIGLVVGAIITGLNTARPLGAE